MRSVCWFLLVHMKHLAPLGAVYQAGTLSGNPVAVACGLATLREIQRPSFYDELGEHSGRLIQGLIEAAHQAAPGWDFAADRIGGMFGIYFSAQAPISHAQVMAADKDRFNRFFHAMLDQGVYLAPSAFEAGFVSIAHNAAVIDATLVAAREAFAHAQESPRTGEIAGR